MILDIIITYNLFLFFLNQLVPSSLNDEMTLWRGMKPVKSKWKGKFLYYKFIINQSTLTIISSPSNYKIR